MTQIHSFSGVQFGAIRGAIRVTGPNRQETVTELTEKGANELDWASRAFHRDGDTVVVFADDAPADFAQFDGKGDFAKASALITTDRVLGADVTKLLRSRTSSFGTINTVA